MKTREEPGRMVREVWIEWANEQPDARPYHPRWLLPWEQLNERDKEVDRRIGERLFAQGLRQAAWIAGIECPQCRRNLSNEILAAAERAEEGTK